LTKLQAELTTLKSKRLDGTILMDLGNWYTIQGIFKAQWKGTQNKSKIQENLDTQNAAFHLLELPFKSWKTVLDGKAAARLKIKQPPQLNEVVSFKISPFLRANSRR
jgi:exonuclease SbcC